MPAINVVDGLITFRIIKMLVTPWTSTKAYHLGIIDADGNPLKKSDDLKTAEEQSAYTILDRLVFKLKRLLQGIPVISRNLTNFAAALWLVKECYRTNEEPENIAALYEQIANVSMQMEQRELLEFNKQHPSLLLHRAMLNEDGAAVGGGAPVGGDAPAGTGNIPANRVGGDKIAGFKPADVGRRKFVKKILRRRPPMGEPSNATSPLA